MIEITTYLILLCMYAVLILLFALVIRSNDIYKANIQQENADMKAELDSKMKDSCDLIEAYYSLSTERNYLKERLVSELKFIDTLLCDHIKLMVKYENVQTELCSARSRIGGYKTASQNWKKKYEDLKGKV